MQNILNASIWYVKLMCAGLILIFFTVFGLKRR